MEEIQESQPLSPAKKLTRKQRIFIDVYIRTLNARKAALEAGYKLKAATQMGYENLSKPYIREEIDRILRERHLSADQLIDILEQQATSDMADLVDENGEIDLKLAQESGKSKLVKSLSIKYDRDGNVVGRETQLYDAQAAAVHLLKLQGKFIERKEISGPNGQSLIPPGFIRIVVNSGQENGNE